MKFVTTRYSNIVRDAPRGSKGDTVIHSDKGAQCSWNSPVTSRIWRKLGTLLAYGNRSRALIR